MKYSREQLVMDMQKFHQAFLADKDNFQEITESIESAENQVDQLISYVE